MATPPTTTKGRYFEAVGRRKCSVARVRVTPNTRQSFQVNEKTLEDFFPSFETQNIVLSPIKQVGSKYLITVKVQGGGVHAQAEAIRLGVARAILLIDPNLRHVFKKSGYLKRDPRAKERRKFGLKKARKSAQWRKR